MARYNDQDRSQRLADFVAWVGQHITGDEKGEAQIYLDRLFQAFGQPGSLEVGGTPEYRVKPGKEDDGGTSFADYVWKPVVLIEMKKRGVNLTKHRQQAFDYWLKLVPHRPQYVVLCNFDEFHIYDFNIDIDEPLDNLTLAALPKRYDPLAFLFPTNETPLFQNNRVEVTRNAVDRLAAIFNELVLRKTDPNVAQRFILQLLVALFAEDIDLLPHSFLSHLIAEIKDPSESYDLIGNLFEAMNRPGGTAGGRYKGVRYFNGGLFQNPAKVELSDIELNHLRQAVKYDWSKVSPDIFGTLFQDSMGKAERHAFGAHYTAPIDIIKIVRPTLVEPWQQLITSAKTPRELLDLLERLTTVQVLDPACGSGNFLYVAYRAVKRLEADIRKRLQEEFPRTQLPLLHVNARQFHGIDILPFAIELAKVTMMLARKMAIDELDISDEAPLPLDNLDQNFRCVDALMHKGPTGKYSVTTWPQADIIIGNPPFLGAKRLKPERGPDYVNTLRELYPEIPGMADYCVYWFRRAQDHLSICDPKRPESGRAGLVGTQNIRNNQSRVGSLDYIVKMGIIVEAVDNQPWSGEANVHVSIANWVKMDPKGHQSKNLIPANKKIWSEVDPNSVDAIRTKSHLIVNTAGKRSKIRLDKSYELGYQLVPNINAYLRGADKSNQALALLCNKNPQRAFQGVTPGYDVFVLEPEQKELFLTKAPAETKKLVKPYLIGRELVSDSGKPQRYIIDMNIDDGLGLLQYPYFFKYLEKALLPKVAQKAREALTANADMHGARKEHLNRWWSFWARRTELRGWMCNHQRIIASSRTQRWPFIFTFISTEIVPGDKLQLFSFDDDYSLGILQSSAHMLWFKTRSSRLKNEADYNYSSASVFDTFPWPQSPTKKLINTIAKTGSVIQRIRSESFTKTKGGLRALYRMLELPGKNPLKDAHAALDTAVCDAYGFDPKGNLLEQLLALNLEVAQRIADGKPVTAPGIPPSYGDPKALITEDCIKP